MRDQVTRLARDSVYVSVGFGVLAFQRLQVRRRELEKLVERQAASTSPRAVPGDGQAGESQAGESQAGTSQPSDSQPSDSQPSDGRPDGGRPGDPDPAAS